jgi:hypothetical protein
MSNLSTTIYVMALGMDQLLMKLDIIPFTGWFGHKYGAHDHTDIFDAMGYKIPMVVTGNRSNLE